MKSESTDTQLLKSLFSQREYHQSHLPYEKELRFYEAVKEGDIELLKEIMVPLDNARLGVLSKHPLRNLQYHLTITIAFITRFCIEGGMEIETAYTLSDVNIRKLDRCRDTSEVSKLHQEVVMDYALRMQKIHLENSNSLIVTKCIDYIYKNLHDPITIDELAAYTRKNPTYLCQIFKQEMNITIAKFIRGKRIEAAKNMLRYSDYSSVDISNYLSFNSHSHFISVFKKNTGMTPKEYRKQYYRSKWK
ncbi:MAG: helix-turn-helix domain-containing protein [bacterium]|nr:helix-turn-helix domain-containing protein [bacterium]